MTEIACLFISPGHNFFGHHGQPAGTHPTRSVDYIECLAGQGIQGDRFLGFKQNYKGQITFFDMAVFEALQRELSLPDAQPARTRRNVFTRNMNLDSLLGVEFEIQGIRFLGTEECRPCYWMNSALGPGAEEWLRGRGGLRAAILSSGTLRKTPVYSQPIAAAA